METPKESRAGADRPFNQLLAVVLAVIFAVAVVFAINYFHLDSLIEDLELKTYDMRAFLQKGPLAHQPSENIVIVQFDDVTLNTFEDEFGTWPWPRNVHADMMGWFNDAGARMVAYDIMFVSRQKGSHEQDQQLIDAFRRYPNVYIGMNFDNNYGLLKDMRKAPGAEAFRSIQPLSISIENQLARHNESGLLRPRVLNLDASGQFFENPGMTYNNFRGILPGLLAQKQRIAFVNHSRDKDGVSRSNPLFFRLEWEEPLISAARPFRFDAAAGAWKDQEAGEQRGKWLDAKNEWINAQGCRMQPQNPAKTIARCQKTLHTDYYPYMGLRMLLDLKNAGKSTSRIVLTRNGELRIDGSSLTVPLDADGAMLLKWYNMSIEQEAIEVSLKQMEEARLAMAVEHPGDVPQIKAVEEQLRSQLQRDFPPKPYAEISAWRILKAMKDERSGGLTAADKDLKNSLKNKVIFVGTTAVATYDIKTTPIAQAMPGVVIQATVFDNLQQNAGFMRRIDDIYNILLMLALCAISATAIFRLRSALAASMVVAVLLALYLGAAVLAFQKLNLWINTAAPLIAVTVVTMLTYMIKYVSKNRAYERTYVMATTDAMTGLKNHRFFQEHLRESIQFSNRFNSKFSLLLIDIDHFKKFNDSFGHQAGDEVLRAVARKLKTSVRSNDLVARYGGEEMAIVLDKANEREALEVGAKIVRAVAEEAYPIAAGVSKHVTISVGAATYPTHGKTPAELIEFSDQGLYRAKESGRNRVGAQYDADMPPKEADSGSAGDSHKPA
ncbi:MAG: diguanylate cyclase [Vampirovibrionales bacterium]|nr:diguanylate cyclase [Vampirovibrionales bacterium]